MALRLPLTLLTALCCTTLVTEVCAQTTSTSTITMPATGIDRNPVRNVNDATRYWLTHDDCLANVEYTFRPVLSNFVGMTLEIWVSIGGGSCATYAARRGPTPTCWLVYAGNPPTAYPEIKLKAWDILAGVQSGVTVNPVKGTIETCAKYTSSTPQTATLSFDLLAAAATTDLTGGYDYPLKFDFAGPAAPTELATGTGEATIPLTWKGVTGTDLRGYRFYCAPAGTPGNSGPPVVGGTATGGTSSTGGTAGASSTGGTVSTGGAPAQAGATSTGGTVATGGAVATGSTAGATSTGGSSTAVSGLANPECATNVLLPGTLPDPKWECGSADATSASGVAKSDLIKNGTIYAVAIAAIDNVGNSGPLSPNICAAPVPVEDFYEVYRAEGGKGGGGFCSLGHRPSSATLGLLGLTAALALLRRRNSAPRSRH